MSRKSEHIHWTDCDNESKPLLEAEHFKFNHFVKFLRRKDNLNVKYINE